VFVSTLLGIFYDSLIQNYKLKNIAANEVDFYMEFLLHGIAENSLISKKYTNTSIDFKDLISDIFNGKEGIT